MATPPYPPPPPGGPFPPGDPRNNPYGDPRFAADPRMRREHERMWRNAQRDAFRQQKRAGKQQMRMAEEARRAQIRAMRRVHRAHSFVGPLLLIGFAVLALLVYNGRISGPALVNWFGRWWPLVLITAGVVRLLEWAIARAQSEDRTVPVRFSLGGGTVALLFLLAFAGIASQGMVHASEHGYEITTPFFDGGPNGWQQFFGSRHEEDAPAQTHTIATDGTLEITNSRGDVTVTGTSDDGMVHVAQHREVFANTDSRAGDLFSRLDPQFSGSDSNLTLRVNGPDNSSSALTLLVPRGVHVVLNTNRGDAIVNSFHAPVTVNANRGDVNVNAVAGDVDIHMNGRHSSLQVHNTQGAVRVTGSGEEINLNDINGPVHVGGDFFGSGRLQHVTGAVDYDAARIGFTAARVDGEVSFDTKDEFSATGVVGPVTLKTRSRDVTLTRVAGDVHVSNSSGQVNIVAVPPHGSVSIDNRDGDVRVSLPAGSGFNVSAETSDGSISSDFPGINGTGQSAHGSLSGTIGSGGPSVRLTTTHGNITLAKNSDGPLPPVPPLPPLTFSMPADAQDSLRKAQAQLDAAATAMRDAQREGANQRDTGLQEAKKARAQAAEEMRKAQTEVKKAAEEARREAEKSAHE